MDGRNMTIEELRQKLIEELEPAFFVGGFGGAMLEIEEIKRATPEELIKIASRHGYYIELENAFQKTKKF